MPTNTIPHLETRVTDLTSQIAKLLQADAPQRSALIRCRAILLEMEAGAIVSPTRVSKLVADIDRVLGTDGMTGQNPDHWNCKG